MERQYVGQEKLPDPKPVDFFSIPGYNIGAEGYTERILIAIIRPRLKVFYSSEIRL